MKVIAFYIFILLLPTLSLGQSEDNRIQREINRFSNEEGIENAAISFMAYNLDKDSVLSVLNEKMAIPSASTVKLFTTATALEVLGKDYKPTTELYYDGKIDSSGILNGNIIIRGLGDPSLGSRFFYTKETKDDFLNDWIQLISEKGIKQINGSIISDGSAFGYHGVPDGWTWSDMGNYYGSGPSASAVYDNMTYLHFSTSNQLGGKTFIDSTTPPIPGMEIYNEVTTYNSNSDNAYIYGAPYSYQRFAIGNLPRNRSNFEVKATVPDPELLLAQVLESALIKQGILVSDSAIGWRSILLSGEEGNIETTIKYNALSLIGIYEGKSIEELVYWTNLRSVNFFAEQLTHLISLGTNKDASYKASMRFINQYWEGRLGVKMFQTDGSGLARNNAFSANHFIQLLKYMYASKSFKDFETSLPVAGESGTLRSVCRGQAAQGRLKAKSGTLNRVKAYSGYVDTQSGDKIAFAIIVNNFDLSGNQLGKLIERLFNEMANW